MLWKISNLWKTAIPERCTSKSKYWLYIFLIICYHRSLPPTSSQNSFSSSCHSKKNRWGQGCTSPYRPCSHNSPPSSIITSHATMTRNIRLFIFHIICNFWKCDDFTVLLICSILSYSMASMLLSSPLQPQSDTKVIPDKKGTLMTGFFLLADSMLEVYPEWETKKF